MSVASTPGKSERDYVVCGVGELPPGSVKVIPVGKFGVGVYNVDGEFFALTNYCPHQGAPLCKGPVRGTNRWHPDRPTKFERVLEGQILRCPWHGWEFDITTGHTITDPSRGIRTYPVRVVDGEVLVRR